MKCYSSKYPLVHLTNTFQNLVCARLGSECLIRSQPSLVKNLQTIFWFTLNQGLAQFFSKGLDSMYFSLDDL
jgi:hypothetical protein